MPRSPSPERYPPVRRRGSGASHMQLQNHIHHHRRSPSPPARRALRPRRAAASGPLVDDFFPFPSSPSSSPSGPRQRRPSREPSSSDSGDGGGAFSVSDRRRRKLKLVVKLSQLPPDQHQRRVPPPPPYSDNSDGEEEVREDGSDDEDQVKPPKKRRIEQRGDRSRHREVAGGRSDAASAPRTKRLPVPGTLRTTPLPDLKALEMILDKLQKKDTYGVFAEPVDPEDLPDYHDVIEHPMDFGTVRRKLARNLYRSFEQFEADQMPPSLGVVAVVRPFTIRRRHTAGRIPTPSRKGHRAALCPADPPSSTPPRTSPSPAINPPRSTRFEPNLEGQSGECEGSRNGEQMAECSPFSSLDREGDAPAHATWKAAQRNGSGEKRRGAGWRGSARHCTGGAGRGRCGRE